MQDTIGWQTEPCIYLNSRGDERLLMGERLGGITFEGILRDTQRHYAESGGIERALMDMRRGSEVSIYHRDEEGEEEVLGMLVRVPICELKQPKYPDR